MDDITKRHLEDTGRSAAQSIMIGFALALATRNDESPAHRLDSILEAVKSVVDEARGKIAEGEAGEEAADAFIAAFNTEVDYAKTIAKSMLESIGAKDASTKGG